MTATPVIGVPAARTPARRFPTIGWIGLAIVGLFVVVAVAAPWISPYGPLERAVQTVQAPSRHDLLGTNQIGQDILSQLIAGARVSLLMAVLAGGGSVLIGSVVGITAGWVGGWPDLVLMRLTDLFLAVPRLPLLVVVGTYAGRSFTALALVIAAVFWPGTARLLRGQIRSLRSRMHVRAALGFGAGSLHILRRHVVPDVGLLLVASLVGAAGRAILLEAGLAFLGLGDPSRTSWGSIMRDARQSPGLFYTHYWTWWMLPPITAIFVLLLGMTFLGVAVEQRINPRLARHARGPVPGALPRPT